LSLLAKEPVAVRVTAVHRHEEKLARLPSAYRARRTEGTHEYWRQLLSEARVQVATEVIEWQ
jgi:hypothetical protein